MKTSFAFWSANRSKPKKFNSLFSRSWKKLPPTVQKQNNKNKIMKRKTRSCSISMRPMHVSVFVCVCAYKWATSAAVVDIFACAFYMGVFGYTLRRSTSTSPSLALFALHFPFCCCFFSLIFNATKPGSIPCMWLYFNSLPRVRSSPSPSPFSVCLQLWHVACFTFALFLSFFFSI